MIPDKPEKPEDEFKVDVFTEGWGKEIPDEDGVVVMYNYDLYAPDQKMKHMASTRTDIRRRGEPMQPHIMIFGHETEILGLRKAFVGKKSGFTLGAHIPPSMCYAGR